MIRHTKLVIFIAFEIFYNVPGRNTCFKLDQTGVMMNITRLLSHRSLDVQLGVSPDGG